MASKKTSVPSPYTVHLNLGVGADYKASGDDLTAVLLSLPAEKVNYRGVFTLEHNGKKASLMRNVFFTRRVLKNKLTAFMFGRNLLLMLK